MSNNDESYEDAILRELEGVVQKNANTSSMSVVSNTKEESCIVAPTLYKFYADWCGPCRVLSRFLDELKAEGYFFNVLEINVDSTNSRDKELIKKYGVLSIPTLLVFKGTISEPIVFRGLVSKEELKKHIPYAPNETLFSQEELKDINEKLNKKRGG